MARRPMLRGWKPSTSFSMLMASSTRCSSMCLGMGSCTRMPCTLGSALKSATTCKREGAWEGGVGWCMVSSHVRWIQR